MNQLHNLLIAEGFISSLSFKKNINKIMSDPITGKEYKCRDTWVIAIRGNQNFGKYIGMKDDIRDKTKFRIYRDKNYIYYPIYKITKEKYDGLVYDLTVDKEHNYVTHFLVKNSGDANETSRFF